MNLLPFLAIGLVAGVFGGMFGIGGGLIMVPALAFIAKFDLRNAIATSLAAQIPPVALLGAIQYYKAGDVNVRAAAIIAVGLFLGAYVGARLTLSMDKAMVQKIYALFLIAVALKMLVTGK